MGRSPAVITALGCQAFLQWSSGSLLPISMLWAPSSWISSVPEHLRKWGKGRAFGSLVQLWLQGSLEREGLPFQLYGKRYSLPPPGFPVPIWEAGSNSGPPETNIVSIYSRTWSSPAPFSGPSAPSQGGGRWFGWRRTLCSIFLPPLTCVPVWCPSL